MCLLLSFSGPYSYSLRGNPKPISLLVSHFYSRTHTHCCFKLLTLQSTHALQESQKRGDILLYTHTQNITSRASLLPAQHFSLQLAMRSCRLWTQIHYNCDWAQSTSVWIWSTSIYPYLLMYVFMNLSPVIVLYSLRDKWSLKETLVWIRYLALLEWLFV